MTQTSAVDKLHECTNRLNKHPVGCEPQVKMPIHAHFFRQVILTRKVGQTDLVYAMRSECISRSVNAELQVSVFSNFDLFHPG